MTDSPIVNPLGTTPGGLPYPEDTDLVLAGAQAIKALAQAMDARPRLRARKAGAYNIAGNGNDIEQGSGSAAWDLFETNYQNASDTVGMVCPLAGFYLCMASAGLSLAASTTNCMYGVKVTNAAQASEGLHEQRYISTGAGGARFHASVANLVKANIGDILRMSAHQNSGATLSLGGSGVDMTRFSIVYWGP